MRVQIALQSRSLNILFSKVVAVDIVLPFEFLSDTYYVNQSPETIVVEDKQIPQIT